MSRRGCSLPANASGFDPHRASISRRFGQVRWGLAPGDAARLAALLRRCRELGDERALARLLPLGHRAGGAAAAPTGGAGPQEVSGHTSAGGDHGSATM
jgi:hypothetical protein